MHWPVHPSARDLDVLGGALLIHLRRHPLPVVALDLTRGEPAINLVHQHAFTWPRCRETISASAPARMARTAYVLVPHGVPLEGGPAFDDERIARCDVRVLSVPSIASLALVSRGK